MIKELEELSLNAWPALQTILYDGWVLRFARGYTRRANSIVPLYPAKISPVEKFARCEAIYRLQNLPVVYKLAGRDQARDLDQLLSEHGYQPEADTSVQLASLRNWLPDPVPGVTLSTDENPEWEAAFRLIGGLDDHRNKIHHQILRSILLPKCYASIYQDRHLIGCGLGVWQDGYIGIFDVAILPEYRRQGYGERLMRGLLAWGCQQEAHSAYLQVMLNNDPALRLYTRLGFREVYQYWYRVKKTGA